MSLDLQHPLDLTDRLVLAQWLARVREHVTALDKLLQAVPPMPFLLVQVSGAGGELPTVTLQREGAPDETLVLPLLSQSNAEQAVVRMPNGEIRVFTYSSGLERLDPFDHRGRCGWRLVPESAPSLEHPAR